MVLAAVIVRMGPLFGAHRSILVRLDIVKCTDELRVCVRALLLPNVSCWSWRRRRWISIDTSLTIVLVKDGEVIHIFDPFSFHFRLEGP